MSAAVFSGGNEMDPRGRAVCQQLESLCEWQAGHLSGTWFATVWGVEMSVFSIQSYNTNAAAKICIIPTLAQFST